MMKRVLVAAGLVVALVAGGAIAVAQGQRPGPGFPGGPGGPGGRGPGGPGMRGGGPGFDLRGIELTDSQREQIRTIMESHKTEFDAAASKLRDAHRAFAEAVEAETADENAIRSASTAIGAAMADEAILRTKVRGDVQNILTAEQQQQLKERRAEMEKRRGDRQQQLQERRQGRRGQR